jgi:flagellar hook-length control protein FliK
MNDMRLPGLGQLTNDAPTSTMGADAPNDPAQAFDAVMSRFAGERPAPAATTAQDTAKPPKNAPANAGGATDKTPKSAADSSTPVSGKPVVRSKPGTSDDEGETDVVTAAATDPTALAAAVAGAAQFAAANPAAPAPTPGTDGAKPATGKDVKATVAPAATALDVLAAQTNAAGRNAEKAALDPRTTNDEDDGAAVPPTGKQNRRAPPAAKDTLRFDAPLMRTLATMQADVAQRVAGVVNPLARTTAPAVAATEVEATPQMLTAALGSTTAATYSIAHAAVGATVGTPAFADELAQRVVMFTGQKVQRADIAVTPADLGPIAVSIEVRGQEATLAFAASSHTTRAAIEDALPRLRDMLSAQGLQLAGTHVGSEPRRDPYRPARSEQNNGGTGRGNAALAPVDVAAAPGVRRRVNLIDIEV